MIPLLVAYLLIGFVVGVRVARSEIGRPPGGPSAIFSGAVVMTTALGWPLALVACVLALVGRIALIGRR